MIDHQIENLILYLQTLPSEFASLLTFLVCIVMIIGACRYGYAGLWVYSALAVVVANIQVLRLGIYWSTPEPIALGTVLFATTFLASDIITEHFGPKAARQSITISFAAQLVVSLWMILCLAHPGIKEIHQEDIYKSLFIVFLPSARFFISSLIAYIISQHIDILIYQWIKNKTNGRHLWLRQNISTFISGLIDNFLFSILAWIVFNPEPLTLYSVIISYVLAGYIVRFIINILGTPILYLSYRFIRPSYKDKANNITFR
jgi:uncharacterized integral membrane protein (TIGR00697 family)